MAVSPLNLNTLSSPLNHPADIPSFQVDCGGNSNGTEIYKVCSCLLPLLSRIVLVDE